MHRTRRLVGLSLCAAPLLFPTASGASSLVALWHLDETARASVMRDASPHRNDGRVRGAVTGVPGFRGRAYSFGNPSIVTVPDDPSLDPGNAPISITLHLRTTKTAGDWNVLQKGHQTVAGGNYKIAVEPVGGGATATALCYFRGSRASSSISGGPDVTDGQWHAVGCSKTASGTALRVDGRTVATGATAVGSIGNNAQLTIGAKAPGGDDQYLGDLDEIRITVG